MESVERRSHPSVPANYVSLVDLRERWMKKQQQQKKKVEEIEQKELQESSELQVDQEQVKSEKTSGYYFPANYVSILDLRERWMKQQQQNKQVEEIEQNLQENSEPEVDQEQVNSEVEDKNDGDDNLREERHPDDNTVVQASNHLPITANQKHSNRKPRDGKEGNKRWVPLKQAPITTVIRPKQALSTQSSDPEPVLSTVDPVKPPLLEIAKVETVVQGPARIRDADEKVTGQKFNGVTKWKAKVRNQKRNLKDVLLQSQPKKGVAVALEEPTVLLAVHAHLLKPPPLEADKVDTAIQVTGEIKDSGEEDKCTKLNNGKTKKANAARNRKRYQNHNLVRSQPQSDVLPPISDLNEKDDARVQLEPKALPDLQSEQLKPSPLEANKVNLTFHTQIQSSDELIADQNLDMIMKKKKKKNKPFNKNQKRNQKVESVIQPHLKKENLAPNAVEEKGSTEQQVVADSNAVYDNGKAETEVVTDIKLDTMMMKKKPWKRIQKVESITQLQIKKENLAPNAVEGKETPEQEVGTNNNAEGGDWRAETEGKVAGLSVTRAPKPDKSCSRGSVTAGTRNWQRKRDSYVNLKRPIMMKKERAWGKCSLVWVKKGESAQTGDVAVENSGNIRV